MAWTKAARDAAAEARKQHGKSVGLHATVVRDNAAELRILQMQYNASVAGGVNPRSHVLARMRKRIKHLSK